MWPPVFWSKRKRSTHTGTLGERRGPGSGPRRSALLEPAREGARDGASSNATGEGVVTLEQAPRPASRERPIPRSETRQVLPKEWWAAPQRAPTLGFLAKNQGVEREREREMTRRRRGIYPRAAPEPQPSPSHLSLLDSRENNLSSCGPALSLANRSPAKRFRRQPSGSNPTQPISARQPLWLP